MSNHDDESDGAMTDKYTYISKHLHTDLGVIRY